MNSTSALKIRFFAGLLAVLAIAEANAVENPYWDFSIYGTKDPIQLLQKSIDSESKAEKVRIRSYLAAKLPQTAEGLFSRAWINTYEGKMEESKRLYMECVQRYPQFAVCLNNVVADNPDDEALRKRFLELAPELYDYQPVRGYYTYLGKNGRKDEQKAFVDRMSQRYAGKWIVELLHSLEAKARGDRSAEREALRRAIASNGDNKPPFFVYETLIDLETGYFYQGDGNRLSLAMKLVTQYILQTRRFDEYAPWQYLMENFAVDEHVQKVHILREFVKVYDVMGLAGSGWRRPIPAEALDAISGRGDGNLIDSWLKQFRERFAVRRGSEPAVDVTLLWFETITDGSLQALAPKWQSLVANALTEKDAAAYAVSALSGLVTQRADCNWAQRLAPGWNQRFVQSAYYHNYAFEAALCVSDLASARQHLEAVARLESTQNTSARSDRLRLALAEDQAKAWSEQERKNPFLQQWDKKDGGRVALNIEFASGLAAIPPRYFEPLNQLARLIKENGADDYQFDIAGHTDSRGSAALNKTLSEQRAQSVVDYLVAKAGIERGRLIYSGHGSAIPMASNATDAGMQQNRRVEITPRANLRTPVLAKEGYPSGSGTFSPDGRVLATTSALWDVKTRLKLHDLPYGYARFMQFLPSGRVLVRMNEMQWPSRTEMVVELVDVASGLVMRRQLISGSVESGSVSPDGRRLAMIVNGHVQIYELPTLQLRKQRMLSVMAGVGKIAWLDNDRVAAAVRYGGEKLHLLNASTLATQKVFDDIDYVHTLGVSSSGKYLVVITNDGGILHVWDTRSWQHKAQRLGVFADHFAFHPFEEKALINQWNGSEKNARLIDLESMNVIKTFDVNSGGAFMPDGRHFYLSGRDYDFSTLEHKPWATRNASAAGTSFGTWLPETGQFTTESGKDSQLWDVASGRQIDRLVGLELCNKVEGSPNLFWKCGTDRSVMVERGSWREIANPSGFKRSDTQFLFDQTASRAVVFEDDPAPSKDRVAKRGKLSIVDRASGRILATHPMLLRLEDAIYSRDDTLHSGGIVTAIDPTGRYLAVRVWWKEHWGYPALSGKQVWLFDLENGSEIERVALNSRAEGIAFAPGNTPLLRVSYDTSTGVYDLKRKAWEKREPWSAKETLLAEVGPLKVIALGKNLTLIDGNAPERYVFLRGTPSSVGLYPTQNLMLVYYGSGEFDYFDLKTLTRQLTLHAKEKGEWLAYAPSGEFSASPNGADGYFWALGDKYLPFSALRERFERPDIIARQLQNVVRGTAVAPVPLAATSLRQDSASAQPNSTAPQISAPSQAPASSTGGSHAAVPVIEADLFMPPFSLRVIAPPAKSSDPKLTLKVGITKLRAINLEPEIELNINGQQVKTRGLTRVSASKGCADVNGQVDCEQVLELPVNLDDGRNVVQVSLLYRNARLETQTSVIELERPRQVGQSAPRLWLLAAGVSQYAETKQNLQFAHRDAEELAKAFKAQEGKLYSQVNVKVLTNQQVAKGTLDTEINRFLRQASEQDLIIVLLAGHGVQDNDQTLYFMTHDANMDEPYSGLDVARIRTILRNRPPNQKAILLLDICHAGAIGEGRRGSVSAEDAIKQLSQGTGITVLSSSTGRELSNEAANFRGGHGAFTAAVLEGLEGAADSVVGNRDGTVTISELTTFVARRVPELTRNGQHPTTNSDNLQDFPVATKS